MKLKKMIERSTNENGCLWCRWLRLKHGNHICYCSAYQRNVLIKKADNDSCIKFLRSLNAKEIYNLRIMDKCEILLPGRILNYTGIMPGSMITSDQLLHLLKIMTYEAPVQITVGHVA